MRINKWILASLAVAGVVGVGTAFARFPPLGQDYDIQYFSDPGKTQRVGGERWTCEGAHLSWGTTGAYRITSSLPCNIEQ